MPLARIFCDNTAVRVSVYIAASLDGYIARADGGLDWLTNHPVIPGEDFGYGEFIDSVDGLVIGRHTYETVAGFPDWPYAGKPVVVMSQTLRALPDDHDGSVRLFSGTVRALYEQLTAAGHQRIYLDGGRLIQSFLRSGLVTDLTINRVPVLLGAGVPLFASLDQDIPLDHVQTASYENGFVISRYRTIPDSPVI